MTNQYINAFDREHYRTKNNFQLWMHKNLNLSTAPLIALNTYSYYTMLRTHYASLRAFHSVKITIIRWILNAAMKLLNILYNC